MKCSPFLFLLFCAITNISLAQQKVIRTTFVDGKEREYIVHIPASYNGNELVPLVFMLHGTSGSGGDTYNNSGWVELADKEGFIAVFPSSLRYKIIDNDGPRTTTKWNITPDSEFTFQQGEVGYDDIKFLYKVIEEITTNLKIDVKRIYLNGFSNGGAMAAKCSIEMSDVLAAVCSNAGAFLLDTTYIPKRKLPFLYQVGNRDYGPGNSGPDFPQAPMRLFDSLISTSGITYLNGKHFRIANNVINNFSLKREHTAIVGDTSFAVFTTYQPTDPRDCHEFRYVFVKDLGHSYPNWAPTRHWQWMKNYSLDCLTSSIEENDEAFETKFYPNPASNYVSFYKEVEYKIMDINGKLLKQGVSKDLMIDDLRNGLYFIQVEDKVRKLVVVR